MPDTTPQRKPPPASNNTPRSAAARKAAADTRKQMQAWAVAMSLVYGVIGGSLLGLTIDYFAGTLPWFTLGLCLFGLGWGIWRFIREANAMNRSA